MALKNVGASVRARLLRMAQEKHDSFEGLLVRYVHSFHVAVVSDAGLEVPRPL
jgi:hypothetical protein